jgi:hypothetical protein
VGAPAHGRNVASRKVWNSHGVLERPEAAARHGLDTDRHSGCHSALLAVLKIVTRAAAEEMR